MELFEKERRTQHNIVTNASLVDTEEQNDSANIAEGTIVGTA